MSLEDAAQRWREAREQLAAAIHRVAMDRLLRFRDFAQEAEDVVQRRVLDWLSDIVEGRVTKGNETGFVRRAAYNAGIDRLRELGRTRELLGVDIDLPVPPGGDGVETEQLITQVRRLLASAPPAYRRVIEEHYFRNKPVDDLIEDELRSRPPPRDAVEEAKLRHRARDVVDQRLSRARAWLRDRLVGETGETR